MKLSTRLRRLPARTCVLLAVAVVFAGVWASAEVDSYLLRRTATPLVRELVEEFRPQGLSAATLVTVHREYVLVGEPLMKLELFFRAEGSQERILQGIEFIYVRTGSDWELQESYACSAADARVRGAKAFQQGEIHPVAGGAS